MATNSFESLDASVPSGAPSRIEVRRDVRQLDARS
jgi:hypothetical protein